jgi:hypothetical protein
MNSNTGVMTTLVAIHLHMCIKFLGGCHIIVRNLGLFTIELLFCEKNLFLLTKFNQRAVALTIILIYNTANYKILPSICIILILMKHKKRSFKKHMCVRNYNIYRNEK